MHVGRLFAASATITVSLDCRVGRCCILVLKPALFRKSSPAPPSGLPLYFQPQLQPRKITAAISRAHQVWKPVLTCSYHHTRVLLPCVFHVTPPKHELQQPPPSRLQRTLLTPSALPPPVPLSRSPPSTIFSMNPSHPGHPRPDRDGRQLDRRKVVRVHLGGELVGRRERRDRLRQPQGRVRHGRAGTHLIVFVLVGQRDTFWHGYRPGPGRLLCAGKEAHALPLALSFPSALVRLFSRAPNLA